MVCQGLFPDVPTLAAVFTLHVGPREFLCMFLHLPAVVQAPLVGAALPGVGVGAGVILFDSHPALV